MIAALTPIIEVKEKLFQYERNLTSTLSMGEESILNLKALQIFGQFLNERVIGSSSRSGSEDKAQIVDKFVTFIFTVFDAVRKAWDIENESKYHRLPTNKIFLGMSFSIKCELANFLNPEIIKFFEY